MNYADFIDEDDYESDNEITIEFVNGNIPDSNTVQDIDEPEYVEIDDKDKNAFVNMFMYCYNDFINVFLSYYKKLFNKKENATGFDGINFSKDNSTNKWMELFMEHIQKYKNANGNLATIYPMSTTEIDINDCEELYLLDIDNEDKKICKLLIPLIKYLADKDWTNLQWTIIPLK